MTTDSILSEFWCTLSPYDRLSLFPSFHPLTCGSAYDELTGDEKLLVNELYEGARA